MVQVEEVDFPVLELVQPPGKLLGVWRRRPGPSPAARGGARGAREIFPCTGAEHRKQLLVLQADEILPEERACARGAARGRAGRSGSERSSTQRACPRCGNDVLHQLLETQERRQRVRGAAQERGELLREEHGELDAIDAALVRDRSPRGVHELELVLDPSLLRADGDVLDGNVLQGEGGGEGVEEERGVLRLHAHAGARHR